MIQCSYRRSLRHDSNSLTQAHVTIDQKLQQPSNHKTSEILEMNTQVHAVMEKVDILNDKLNTLVPSAAAREPAANIIEDSQLNPLIYTDPKHCSVQPSVTTGTETISPEYHGPTSSEFSFRVANDSLTELGVECSVSCIAQPDHHLFSQSITRIPATDKMVLRRLLMRDPLWHINRADASNHIERYRNSLGAMYPVIDDQYLQGKFDSLFDALAGARSGSCREGIGSLVELLFSNDVHIIKIVIAIGMVQKASSPRNDAALQMMQSVLEASDDSLMDVEGLDGVRLLVLTVIIGLSSLLYHFH